jgi:hypothetical protein
MILAKSSLEARANPTHIRHPDGRETWVSRFFTASADAPEQPVAFLVEKKAHAIVPPHFHEVNQFQVIVEGYGRLGKQDVRPFTVHYTNGFTGYGPITAEDEGIAFFTLRNRFDSGARYFPQDRPLMKPAPKRHRMPGPIGLSDADSLTKRQDDALETVIAPEDDGLAAWFLRVAPGATAHAPHPNQGGGQYVLVAGGNLLQDGDALPCLSCLYVSADEEPLTLQAGPQGLEVLIMQFPTVEAYTTA